MGIELGKKLDPISESVALIYSILVFTILALSLGMKVRICNCLLRLGFFPRAQDNLRSLRAAPARVPASGSAMEPRRGNVCYPSLAQLLQFAVESRSGSHGESSAVSLARCG